MGSLSTTLSQSQKEVPTQTLKQSSSCMASGHLQSTGVGIFRSSQLVAIGALPGLLVVYVQATVLSSARVKSA
jgi:hypothetical protein